jgi:hypothetical protein
LRARRMAEPSSLESFSNSLMASSITDRDNKRDFDRI